MKKLRPMRRTNFGENPMSDYNRESSVFLRNRPVAGNVRSISSSSAFTSHRAIVEVDKNEWVRELKTRFDELTCLERGWDGYNGVPVSFTCAEFAAAILERLCLPNVPAPSLVPGSDGTIQIEWHRNQYDVEIHVLGANNVVAHRYDYRTELGDTLELQSDFTEIVSWINDLAMDHDVVLQNEA